MPVRRRLPWIAPSLLAAAVAALLASPAASRADDGEAQLRADVAKLLDRYADAYERFAKVIAVCEERIKASPDDPFAHLTLARVAASRRNWPRAAAQAEKAETGAGGDALERALAHRLDALHAE